MGNVFEESLDRIWRIYIFGYGQFWFLQALFLVFITITFLEYFNITRKLSGWIASMLVSIAVLLLFAPLIKLDIFSVYHYFYLLPFFMLGIGINRFKEELYNKKTFFIILSFLVIGLIVQQLKWFQIIDIQDRKYGFLGVFVGITGIYTIFRFRFNYKPLGNLGYYAYGIFLFHVFGTAGSRIVSKYFGIESTLLLFLIGVLFGLGVPIIIEKYILLKNRYLRMIFLGLK